MMLVNTAGVAHYIAPAELPADKARELIHVMVVAPTMLTRSVLPGMVERGCGSSTPWSGAHRVFGLLSGGVLAAYLAHHHGRPAIRNSGQRLFFVGPAFRCAWLWLKTDGWRQR
jgi:NAD(P)-dependent dehydrogenase (short-subunit alcohol dehydrogenase family)